MRGVIVFTANDGAVSTSATVTIAVTALPPPDAGTPDAAVPVDAIEAVDARSAPDASPAGDGGDGGCGGRTSSNASGALWLALLWFVATTRRHPR